MKKYNILKVILITILVVTLCTWLFPSASFQTELIEGERAQVGLFDLFSYPMVALTYFINIVFYVLVVGMFYGVANRIPAYKALLDKIVKGFRGKEHIFLSAIVILIALIVSVTGLSFAIIFVFPFIISAILMMGYNKLVAASVTVGSTIAGIAGTTLGNNTVYYVNQVLGTSIFDEMLTKVIVLVLFIVLLITNILLYAKKTMNQEEVKVVPSKKTESVIEEDEEEVKVKKVEKKDDKKKVDSKKDTKSKSSTKSNSNKKTASKSKKTSAAMAKKDYEEMKVKANDKKVCIWPFVLIFDLLLVFIGLSIFNWTGLYEISLFEDMTKAITEFEIAGFPIFGKILGTVGSFGEWTINVEIPALIIMATIILGLVYRVKFDDFIDGLKDGIRKSARPAIMMMLAYVVLVIVTYHPFQLVFTKALLGFSEGLNVVTMTIAAVLSSVFNVELTYVSQSTLPYVITVITDTKLYPLIGVIFQSIYGLVMLVAPTSVILLGTLSYLEIPYGEWLKHIWKLFLQLLAVLVVIFLIVLVI